MKKEFKVKILKNASLKDYCTFKIGGSANYVFIVENTFSLIQVIRYLKEKNIKFKVIGMGANLLFSDDGFNGGIIVNRSKNIEICNKSVIADSGVNVTSLIQKCIKKNLAGFESLAGIPSTVGGAVVNSLSAFDVGFCEFIDYVICYNPNTDKILKIKGKDCDFGYRTSAFKSNNLIILRVKLKLNKQNCNTTKNNMENAIKKKVYFQPLNLPSAGSVFKRGNIIPAKAIDELGLKGLRIGGAEISKKHAGFIVNIDNASCNDVKRLIYSIKQQIYDHYNEILEPEIEFVDY